jgi:murein DD-endopeptidase MepM/ murein hydrolase activator NlpD
VVRSTSGAVVTPMTPPAAPDLAPPPMSDAAVAAAGKGRFAWPLKGEVLSRFGPQGPGQRNDGLNIAAQTGAPVQAAAAGEVVFAGQLPGFGNLVLLKHSGGWVTAYAHLSKLEVKMRDTVGQSQEVGQAGQTGQVDRPQLHFEVRYAPSPKDKARPVDPSLLLPG